MTFKACGLEQIDSSTNTQGQRQATLIVADGSCPKIRELLAEALVPVLWLDARQPPLQRLTALLAERRRLGQPVETLHWVSHGQPGVLRVAAYDIDRDALLAHQQLIAEWGISELALWSCEAGAKKNFISLWQELTGARVWSSEEQLGRNHQGVAHWKLESGAAGKQAPVLPVMQQTLRSWPHQLAAPVASGSPTLTAVTEDTTTPAGDTVANLFSSSFSDADSDTLLGVAITANAADSSTEGVWQYATGNGSNWTAVPTTGLADTTAFYLESDSKLRFLPAADFNGTPGALTAHLIDSTYNGAAGSNSDYFLQFIETASEVKATLTLDPTAFSANSIWSQVNGTGVFATVVGPADAGIGGTVGTVASPARNAYDKSDITLSANIPLIGTQPTAPNLVGGDQFSLADSATGDLFGLYSETNDLSGIIAYDENMYNSLVNQTNPVVSTATWNNTTLLELGIGEGTGTFFTTGGSLSFNGAYSIDIFEAGDSINISTNGGTTAISANTLSLGTSVTAVNDVPVTSDIKVGYFSGSSTTTNAALESTIEAINSSAIKDLTNAGITLQADSIAFEAEVDESIPRTTFNLALSSLNFEDGAISTSEGVRDTRKKLLYYSVDDEGEVSALSFDPLVNAGARFYDLDGDGLADYLSLTLIDGGFGDKDEAKNGVIEDPSTAASVALDPVIQTNDDPFNLLTITDPNNAAPAALNLNATITGRSKAVNQIGYILLDGDEVASAKTILGDLDQIKERATILFSSLEADDVTLPDNYTFMRDLLVRNGQSLRFFSLEDTTLDTLKSVKDSRLSFLDSTVNSDGSVSFAASSGLSFNLALNANDQGLNALVAQEQGIAPVLNVTPFTNGEILNGSLVQAREATLDALTGFYKVVDPNGMVMAADGSLIAPGAAGYAKAALRADNLYGGDDFNFSLTNGKTEQSALEMANLSGYLAPYAKVQSNTFFAFAKANSDGISHFRVLGNNIFGLEDQFGGGDRDFDDHIISFQFDSIT
ncbi:DUF4347 domain-containing protein [Synechococcus sp. UW140]|uniref:DUF4347 domain-containing protein n=1 Tax=Synechococcus sp. UW140 TaxID=368503 RepID=UPI000E0F8609|nr:DUF4347 domain-containing protein [Synechococcus sp. UW140]